MALELSVVVFWKNILRIIMRKKKGRAMSKLPSGILK